MQMALGREATVVLFTLAAASLGIGFWQWRRRRKVFVKVGEVKSLFHFPVKSLAGVEVPELECSTYGAVFRGVLDRSFMLANNEGLLISQREEPSLVLLKAEVCDGHVVVKGGDKDRLKMQLKDTVSPDEKVVTACIHGDEVPTVDCGEEAAKWFQDYLKRPDVRVLRYVPEFSKRRCTSTEPSVIKAKKASPVYLQDFGSFHVATQSSLDELNTKSETKVSVLNFRPNIFIDGSKPFDEDNWQYLSFSSGTEMITTIPCSRCILTTNDPETGIKTNKEPLVALRKFRISKDKRLVKLLRYSPCFGIFCSLIKPGNDIKVGDEVYAVISKNLFQF